MDAKAQPWQFSIRTLLLFMTELALLLALIVAWQGLGLLLDILLHGVLLAIVGNRRRRFRLEWCGYVMVAVPLLAFFFCSYTVYQTFFSPDSFTFRATQHLETFGIPLTRGSSTESSRELIDYLCDEGYVKNTNNTAVHWDFVHGSMPSVKGWNGEAKDAYRAFRSEELIDWSKSHPEHARYVWPIVVGHTRARRYHLVRTIMMELYGFDGTVEELQARVKYWEANWNL
jgi:hypothetical protein